MRQLPLRAQVYLYVCYLLGLLALAWLIGSYRGPLLVQDWLIGAGLGVTAAACQLFVVKKNGNNHSDHLTPAVLFAALLLIPRPVLAAVILLTFLPEWWFWRRQWFIQLFNIASYLIAAALVRMSLFWMTGHYRLDGDLTVPPYYVLSVIPIFLGVQTLLLAWVLKLARDESFRSSGLFAPGKFFVEISLACIGLGFATSWLLHPLYGIASALPLALIFQALHVPNLKREAQSDPKTGLANMRHFNTVFARDLERAERSGQPLSVLMCDLDYLRNINNTYGHQAGDIVLIGIADILRRNIRLGDLAARFGGEEFVVLLADTDEAGARHVAERLRSELEQTRFDIGKGKAAISATISIGIASFPEHGRAAETLMHEADLAVYQAKRDGRNRVAVAGRASRELASEWAREHLIAAPLVEPVRAKNEPLAPLWNFINRATGASAVPEPQVVLRMPPLASTATTSEAKSRPPRGRRRPDPGPRILLFIGAILILGLFGLWPGIGAWPATWTPLLLFAALTVLAEQVAVDTSGRGKTSVAVVVVLASALLYHEIGILVTATALAVSVAIKARSRPHRMFFNFGTVLVSARGAHLFFDHIAGVSGGAVSIERMILPAIGAGLVYYAINHLLLCLVRALSEHRNPWQIWHAEYRWLWPHYMVMGALSLVLASSQLAFSWIGVLAMMAPVGMMHLAIKQYMDRTSVYMDELRRVNGRLTDSYEATLQALTRALDTRDEETEEHSQRVRRYSELIARQLGVSETELEDVARGALLHDIGKIGVPDAILLKPGRLTEDERSLMRKHPAIGYNMIVHIPFLSRAAQIVLHHHEAYDGSGYPSGLAGAHIPLGARIFAVADTFDAMTSDRPYRRALSHTAAFEEIARCRGGQFDPTIVDAFMAIPLAEILAVRDGIVRSMPAPAPMSTEQLALVGVRAGAHVAA